VRRSRSIREVDADEHLIERGMIRYVEHSRAGRVPSPDAR
jgi:formyl-CoA transferase